MNHLAHKGIVPSIAIETSSKEILKQFARSGLGVAFMPDMAAVTEREKGSLMRLNWVGEDFPVYSQVIIHKDKRVSRGNRGIFGIGPESKEWRGELMKDFDKQMEMEKHRPERRSIIILMRSFRLDKF